jgi:hypothetical protein
MQLVAWFVMSLASLINSNKIIGTIYYLHEKLNGIAKNTVSSSRSDQLQLHTNTDVIYLTDAHYLWGIKNKVYFYSERTFDATAPAIKSSAPAIYDLTLAGYTFKDLYPFNGGWIGLFRKDAGVQPLFRVKLYDDTFAVTDTIDITLEGEILQGGIFAYDSPFMWVSKGNGLVKVDLRDSSIVFVEPYEFQYWDGKEYTWFNRHIFYDSKTYYFDEMSYRDGNVYSTPSGYFLFGAQFSRPTCPLSFDGTYFYIHQFRWGEAAPSMAIAKKVA